MIRLTRTLIMKKLYRLVLVLTLGLLLLPKAASAHTFAYDGPIRVLLHVDPQDDPPTNTQAQLFFILSDKDDKFLGSHCNCTLIVSGNGKTLLKQKVFTDKSADNNVTTASFVFPRLGVYQISLYGQPKKGFDFHSFRLDYTQRVSQVGEDVKTSRSPLIVIIAGIVTGIGITTIIVMKRRQRHQTSVAPTKKRKSGDN